MDDEQVCFNARWFLQDPLIDITGKYRPLPSFPLGPSLQKEKGRALLPDHSFLAGPSDEGPPSHLVFWREEGCGQTDTHDWKHYPLSYYVHGW